MAILQEVEVVSCLLSGASSLASRVGRTALSLLFFIRFGILAVGARTIWNDEEQDFTCNSSLLLCTASCFNELYPITSFNLFTLQLVVLVTHGLTVACYTRLDFKVKRSWLQTYFRGKKTEVKLHILCLLSKLLIEGLFILTFYKITGGFLHPGVTWCHTQLCETLVQCTDANSAIKNIFSACLCTASAVSATICLGEIAAALQNMQELGRPSNNLLTSGKQLSFMYPPPEYTEPCYRVHDIGHQQLSCNKPSA